MYLATCVMFPAASRVLFPAHRAASHLCRLTSGQIRIELMTLVTASPLNSPAVIAVARWLAGFRFPARSGAVGTEMIVWPCVRSFSMQIGQRVATRRLSDRRQLAAPTADSQLKRSAEPFHSRNDKAPEGDQLHHGTCNATARRRPLRCRYRRHCSMEAAPLRRQIADSRTDRFTAGGRRLKR